MEIYAEQTAPLATLYADKGVLVKVDGMGSVEEVSERLLAALEE
jgi:adenylate kinase